MTPKKVLVQSICPSCKNAMLLHLYYIIESKSIPSYVLLEIGF